MKRKDKKREIPEEVWNKLELSCPKQLPIYHHQDEILDALKNNQVIIITGETGSGKTTQLPKICLKAGRGRKKPIICTQPRRIAAITISQKVAQELGEFGPKLVGYKIRFQDKTGPLTRIIYATDGLLLAKAHKDKLLKSYDTIIVDEAHERSLNIDFLLGLLRKILPKRPDLKVIITSATIDTEQFSKAFKDAPIIEVSGRSYPVDIKYMPFEDEDEEVPLSEKVLRAVYEIRKKDVLGDILVFLPTENEIIDTLNLLRDRFKDKDVLVLPMFGRLASYEQQRIFKPFNGQKIVIATNVAETSITVPGIKYVIDSGLARISRYNLSSHTKALPVQPISKASADQRAGRAGRLSPGICIRLYSEKDYEAMAQFTAPEILRSNLAEVILKLLYLGFGEVTEFPFINPPSPKAIKEGYSTLKELGAINHHRKLTYIGRQMARLPLDPRISRIIIEARRQNALKEILIIASALSIQDPRQRPIEMKGKADEMHRKFSDPASDFITFLRIWNKYKELKENGASNKEIRRFCRDHFLSYNHIRQWEDIHSQLLEILNELKDFPINDKPANYEQIHTSILAGFLSHIALNKDGHKYIGARGKQLYIHPSSSLFKSKPKWIVSYELVRTTKLFARTVAKIDPKWVEELASHLCTRLWSEPRWHKGKGSVVAWERVSLYGLTLIEKRLVDFSRIDPYEAKKIFIRDGLSTGELSGDYDFLKHNKKIIEEIKNLEARTRRPDLLVEEDVIFSLYEKAIFELEKWAEKNLSKHEKRALYKGLITNERALNIVLKRLGSDNILKFTKEQIIKAYPDKNELKLFPGSIKIGEKEFELIYRFSPYKEEDGITVRIPLKDLQELETWPFEWLVPGLLEEKIVYLLKSLPKKIRKKLVPIKNTASEILREIEFSKEPLLDALESCLKKRGVIVEPLMWSFENIPRYLSMRYEIIGENNKVIATGRDIKQLKRQFSKKLTQDFSLDKEILQLKQKYEKAPFDIENIPNFPTEITTYKDINGVKAKHKLYLGIIFKNDKLWINIFPTIEDAQKTTIDAIKKAIIKRLSQQINYIYKISKPPKDLILRLLKLGYTKQLHENIFNYIINSLITLDFTTAIDSKKIKQFLEDIRGKIVHEATLIINQIIKILELKIDIYTELTNLHTNRLKIYKKDSIFEGLLFELNKLVPTNFPKNISREKLIQLPRYLEALRIRIQRAYNNPTKDQQKQQELIDIKTDIENIKNKISSNNITNQQIEQLINKLDIMFEELRIKIFSPEIKTNISVSKNDIIKTIKEINKTLMYLE